MTTEVRKRVLRYAIAADLVILVTGIGLLFPRLSGDTAVVLYLAAVAVAAWKGGGWTGGIVAMLLSLIAAEVVFGTMDGRQAAVFAGASLVLVAAARVARPRARVALPTDPTTLAPVLTFERNGEPDTRPGAEAERLAREVEGRAAADREAARLAAEKKVAADRLARETEKKVALEREAARVATAKKLAEEQKLAAEKKAAAEREALRVATAKKLAEEQKLAAEKKAAAEREAARAREAEEKAARITAEKKVAAEKKLAEDKKLAATLETARREAEEKAARDRETARITAEKRIAAEKKLATERDAVRLASERGAREGQTKASPERVLPAVGAENKPIENPPPKPGLLARMARWLQPEPKPQLALNLQTGKPVVNAGSPPPSPARQPASPQMPPIPPAVPPPATRDEERAAYAAACFNCRVEFDTMEADWCSCLTKERSLVCTNCLICFCKASPSYRETFWMNAPPRLFARQAVCRGRQRRGRPDPGAPLSAQTHSLRHLHAGARRPRDVPHPQGREQRRGAPYSGHDGSLHRHEVPARGHGAFPGRRVPLKAGLDHGSHQPDREAHRRCDGIACPGRPVRAASPGHG